MATEIVLTEQQIIDEYEAARKKYKEAFGDQQKDFWDGYLSAIEFLFDGTVDFERIAA